MSTSTIVGAVTDDARDTPRTGHATLGHADRRARSTRTMHRHRRAGARILGERGLKSLAGQERPRLVATRDRSLELKKLGGRVAEREPPGCVCPNRDPHATQVHVRHKVVVITDHLDHSAAKRDDTTTIRRVERPDAPTVHEAAQPGAAARSTLRLRFRAPEVQRSHQVETGSTTTCFNRFDGSRGPFPLLVIGEPRKRCEIDAI